MSLTLLSSGSFSASAPDRDFQLISRILFHMEMSDKIAGMQQAAQRSVTVPKVNRLGAGMTKMLLAASLRIGENGPSSSLHVKPQVFPRLRFAMVKGPATSEWQIRVFVRKNSTARLSKPS